MSLIQNMTSSESHSLATEREQADERGSVTGKSSMFTTRVNVVCAFNLPPWLDGVNLTRLLITENGR